jgi:hypothetical protein
MSARMKLLKSARAQAGGGAGADGGRGDKTLEHGLPLLVAVLGSIGLGLFFTQREETPYYLDDLGSYLTPIVAVLRERSANPGDPATAAGSPLRPSEVSPIGDSATLEAMIEHFAATLDGNDSLKDLAAEADADTLLMRFLRGHRSGGGGGGEGQDAWPLATARERELCARAIECIARAELGARALVAKGHAATLCAIAMGEDEPSRVRRLAAAAIANMATREDLQLSLARAGAVDALESVQADRFLRRRTQHRALLRLCHGLVSRFEVDDLVLGDDRSAGGASAAGSTMPRTAEDLRDAVRRHATEHERELGSLYFQVSDPLLESGVVMYVNTAIGGALWGFAVATYRRLPLREVLRSTGRTSLVTGLIPAYFVGVAVTAFNARRRDTDTHNSLFGLYTGAFASLYPFYYILPAVDRWSPLWLGGHVVGFMLFSTYLYATDSDLFQTNLRLDKRDRILAGLRSSSTSSGEQEN